MSRSALLVSIILFCCLYLAGRLRADEPSSEPMAPLVVAASNEAAIALQGVQIPAGLHGSVFAAEPLVANPVSFFVDRQGRVFVCESFRQNAGVTDNRGHDQAWLDDDLAAQTVDDRLAYHRKHLGEQLGDYTRQDDRIRLLIDENSDGQADRATVFADHFNRVVDGSGASVLEHQGSVYYTCIPDLWYLRDVDNDGTAEVRQSLHSGFGVRVAFRGHDLHGLIIGPDGRLYFSIGDRGYSVVTADGRLHDPESGAVFRCELDGSHLEVYATGLRNPQELAFDNYGNLFTGDNNSDSGDKARWVYVVEGGDTGWRMAYQYLPDRGPFNREKIWHPYHEGQPGYIIPPIVNFADGPSGLAHYPGTGLPEHFRDRFLLCDFRGGPANSGIRSFRVRQQGAFFELVDEEQTFWNLLATDVQFGPDGAIYVSDWVNGWNGEGKGRIYRFASAADQETTVVREVRELLAGDFSKLPVSRLTELLPHADRRIRSEAQFALADKQCAGVLVEAATNSQNQQARLHALWGLGQIVRREAQLFREVATRVRKLLQDADPEIRAHAVKLLAEAGDQEAIPLLIELLQDEDQRVAYFAAEGLGKLHAVESLSAVTEMLEANADRDPILRHGGIMAMAGMNNPELVAALQQNPSRSVRLAAVVALRKLHSSLVARFLDDGEPLVVIEAARAIHDLPLDEALPGLAAIITRTSSDQELLRRVLNANLRLGGQERAAALASFAAQPDAPSEMRVEALDILATWDVPAKRDRVLGMWRPITGTRDKVEAVAALRPVLGAVLGAPNEVRIKGALVATSFGLPEAGVAWKDLFTDQSQTPQTRADAVQGLASLKAAEADVVISLALTDTSPQVRAAGRRALALLRPDEGIAELARAIRSQHTAERQSALAILAKMPQESAGAAIAAALEMLLQGKIAADTQLDVLEAAAARSSPHILHRLAEYQAGLSKDDHLAGFRETLFGGDAARGERIFFERTDVSCVRCHKVGTRGGEVGPDLSQIAKDKPREYLLEALVEPNRVVAKGFESVVLVDAKGRVHVGVLKGEDEQAVRIITAEAKMLTIPKADIDERQPGKSAMPDDVVKKLSKRDLRDLVEYLSNRK